MGTKVGIPRGTKIWQRVARPRSWAETTPSDERPIEAIGFRVVSPPPLYTVHPVALLSHLLSSHLPTPVSQVKGILHSGNFRNRRLYEFQIVQKIPPSRLGVSISAANKVTPLIFFSSSNPHGNTRETRADLPQSHPPHFPFRRRLMLTAVPLGLRRRRAPLF